MKKKIVFFISIFLIIAISFVVFSNLNTKDGYYENGEIKIFCWGEYMADGTDGSLNILEEFEKKEKVKVASFNTFDSSEQMYAKLKNGNSNYDIIFSCDYMVKKLIDEGLIQKIDTKKLKNYCNIMEKCKGSVWGYDETNSFSIPYSWGSVGIIYNETLVEQIAKEKGRKIITGWKSLLDERFKQQILMFINSRDSFSIAHKILGNSINTTNKNEILNAAEILKKQKPLVQAYVMDEMFDKMENNEAAISVAYSGDIIKMMKNNKNLRYCFPCEGSNIFIDAICIPTNAKNKENALKFIDFLCDPKIALENAKFLSYSTPNKKAWELLDDDIKNNPIAYPPDDVIKKCQLHLPLPKKTNFLIESLWANIRT